ncbi:glycoside hydrolase family 104 protein [Rahnella contaminans]|uniref:glycoside hydrolase family 24 protein n=1 Tax=Rahnella contaminans TaxID=2703882 RepID=UPI003C2F82A8
MSIIPNIKFPIPKSAQGTSFSHAEDILNHLRGEHSGQWLISRSSLFHGGIHISSATTPWCALRGNDVDEPGTGIKGRGEQALICMADGEVVAYRICKDYLKAPWFTGPLSYSGSFVLIKHKVMPGETESSQLTFYTLYMHLAPWTAYQSANTSRFLINEKSGLRAYLDESHEICAGVLPKGTRVIWDGKTTQSFNKRDYAQITLEDDVTGMDWDASAGSQLWVLADHGTSNLKPVEVALPAWWKPLEQPMPVLDAMKFDQVVNLNTPLPIKAGDAIGHMGYFEDAYDHGKESDYRVHIECFTDDERLKTFLTNPEHVKTGEQFLKIVPGLTRTARAPKPPAPEEPEKEGKKSKKTKKKSTPQLWFFTAIDGKTTSTWCLPVSKLPAACPDESGKKYYRIDQESCWIAESDMTPVHQFDLEARGFNAIETSAGDVILHMNGQDKPSDFVSQLLNILKEAAKQYLGVDAALIPDSYQRILNWINGYDGKQWYDTNIIRNAIHYTMLNPQLNMLIVKHPSEWFYKSGSAIWNKPLKDMTDFDPQHATLNKSLIDSLSWMAEVKGVNGSNGVWHMHPIVFIGAIQSKDVGLEEARVRAFLRMIRMCEGTVGEAGYERLFGGESFIKDYHKTFSDHPRIKIKRTNKAGKTYVSSAAGAYQIMGYTWDDPATISWKKQYNVVDFSPASQDRMCIVILKEKVLNDALDMIVKGEITKAITESCSYEWASLPPSRHGQPMISLEKCLSTYNEFLTEELQGKSDLHIEHSFLKDFGYE